MDTSTVETRTEYRIETSEPRRRGAGDGQSPTAGLVGRRGWHFLAFTGAAGPDLATIRGRLGEVRADAREGWRFRLVDHDTERTTP